MVVNIQCRIQITQFFSWKQQAFGHISPTLNCSMTWHYKSRRIPNLLHRFKKLQQLYQKAESCLLVEVHRKGLCLQSAHPTCFFKNCWMSLALWAWERAMALRGSSFTHPELQRRRATTSYPTKRTKKNHRVPIAPGAVNLYLVHQKYNLFSLFACPYLCGFA